MLWLILARALEGVGAGGILAMVMIVIGDIVSLEERGLYAGYISGVVFSSIFNVLIDSGLLRPS